MEEELYRVLGVALKEKKQLLFELRETQKALKARDKELNDMFGV